MVIIRILKTNQWALFQQTRVKILNAISGLQIAGKTNNFLPAVAGCCPEQRKAAPSGSHQKRKKSTIAAMLSFIKTYEGASYFFFWLFGAKMANILFPSNLGMLSNVPTSTRRSANFNSSNSPLSLNIIARPLNCT